MHSEQWYHKQLKHIKTHKTHYKSIMEKLGYFYSPVYPNTIPEMTLTLTSNRHATSEVQLEILLSALVLVQ